MIRTERFAIAWGKPFPKERVKSWTNLLDLCTEARNAIWRYWLVWHTNNGSERSIRDWLKQYAEAKQAKRKGPTCPVVCMPAELGREIYSRVRETVPNLHTRSVVLLQSIMVRDMIKHKAARGSLAGWMAILLNRQGAPSFLGGANIPFDKNNSELIAPEAKGDSWRLQLRIELERERKSIIDSVNLVVAWHRAPILQKIMSGEFGFVGSKLAYDAHRNKWYALISYEMPKKERTHGDGEAVLSPGRVFAWRLRFRGQTIYIGGKCEHIGQRRKSLLRQRIGRQNNYRYSASSTKGHGTDRALQALFALSRAWKDFCHTTNQQLASTVSRICMERGIGMLHIIKPERTRARNRAMAASGQTAGYEKTSSWDWTRAIALLNSRLEKDGIDVTIERLTATSLHETNV